MTLEQRIKDHILAQYLGGSSEGLEDDTPLLELNILDSISIFDILQFLSNSEQVEVPIEEVTPENFASIRTMVHLIERHRTGSN